MIGLLVKKFFSLAYRLTIIGLENGPHITRYYMYNHLKKYNEPRLKNMKVLSISHSEELGRLLGFTDEQITDVSYPEVNILNLPFKDGEFDAVVSDQVLEHVEGNPQHAIDETFRILKEGGLALHTTCFINPIHENTRDYWRFSPKALELLVKDRGDIIDVGGWGNIYAWLFIWLGLRFAPIPNARWHPAHWLATKNTNDCPIPTWVLVKTKK